MIVLKQWILSFEVARYKPSQALIPRYLLDCPLQLSTPFNHLALVSFGLGVGIGGMKENF